MFKNKKIKKLFSVVCTVLTLNSTSSIFQHNPSAIKFNNDDQVDLERPLYCVIVHDDESPNNIWDQIAENSNNNSNCKNKIQAYLDGLLSEKSEKMIKVYSAHTTQYNKAMLALNTEIGDKKCNILFILGITKETDLTKFPRLPATTLISPLSSTDILAQKMKTAKLVPANKKLQVTMLEIKPAGTKRKLLSFDVTINGKPSKLKVYTPDNPFPIEEFAENNITNSEKFRYILQESKITTNPAQPCAFTGQTPQRTFDFQGPLDLEKDDILGQQAERKPREDPITLDEKLHCVVVYDSPFKHGRETQNRWENLESDTFFGTNLAEESSENLTITSIHKDAIKSALPEFLEKAGPQDKILLTIGLTSTNNLHTMPSLPYRFIAIPYSKKLMSDIKTISQKKVLVDLQKNKSEIVCFTLTTDRNGRDEIYEYRQSKQNNMKNIYKSSSYNYQVPEDYPQQLADKLMTVKDLTAWIKANTPNMSDYESLEPQKNQQTHNNSTPPTKARPTSDLTPEKKPELQLDGFDISQSQNFVNGPGYIDHNIPNDPKTYYPHTAWNNPNPNIMDIDPRGNETNPPLTNMSNSTSKDSSYATGSDANFALHDSKTPLVTDLMNEAGYNEEIIPTGTSTYYQYIDEPDSYYNKNELKTTVFSKTKKFVHENPKTSVGLGATIVALGGTVIYKIKKLFTRESKKSQDNNQINQKYNQYVKNKI